ncbi:MAG: hypothetical protein DSM106950_38790 [Stigonema ocellatum SAG 48.90 = DSM 106950]|nr:hypothetical protein [Stigonema ocellatum SAG 48.90 = DSM 106950]
MTKKTQYKLKRTGDRSGFVVALQRRLNRGFFAPKQLQTYQSYQDSLQKALSNG